MVIPAVKLDVEDGALDPPELVRQFTRLQEYKSCIGRLGDRASELCFVAIELCSEYYLLGEWEESRRWREQVANCAEYYFFGDWVEEALTDDGQVDPDWWFRGHGRTPSSNWTNRLRDALCWTSVFSMWDRIDKLMTFPSEEIKADLEGAAARAFYIGQARWWRDHSDLGGLEDAKNIRGAGSKDYHMRCDVLTAISAGDAPLIQKSLVAYVKFWIKRLKIRPSELAAGATFLWHLARREGFVVDLPEELSMHLAIFPEEDQQ